MLSGDPKVPTLHIHGLGDALLPPHLTAGYADAVGKHGNGDFYRTNFVDVAGHCKQSPAETLAAIDTLIDRLNDGKWGDTSPAALNAAADELGGPGRFISHTFSTPFNRAFFPDSSHPF